MAENHCDFEDEDIIINDQDGLPNVHPNLMAEAELDSPDHATDDVFEDLPTSLIVTNVHDNVFQYEGKIIVLFFFIGAGKIRYHFLLGNLMYTANRF